ncbi:MAG: beta-galactosidase trimerization domain-containing protein [Coriobacteriia bacterium]|nr:beta-galactosidase trimerization domain-containing protein [Coriobacteriia bacterium]
MAYYPLDSETSGPADWYAGDVGADLGAFAEARMSLVRVFLSWRVLEPQVGQYNEEAHERLDALVAAARANRLQLIVTLFADDRLAELTEVLWGTRRDPRTDQYLIGREVALVQRIVNRYRSERAIFAWDLANEAFASGFASAEELEAWAAKMREAIRDVDAERPVTLSVDPETLFHGTGVDPREALGDCEFVVSHVTAEYRAYAAEGPVTSGPATYLDSFLLRAAGGHVPVLLDDVGVASLDFSPAEEASYVRTVLYSALMNRAAGVVLRRHRDLDTERREPYFRDPFEVLVGVADTDGVPKPSLGEVRDFARLVARVDLRTHSLAPERTAVVVPGERYASLPRLAGLFDPRACLQSYTSAKEAHLPVTVVGETEEFGAYSVLVVPSAFDLEGETWDRLAGFVQGGGSVVLSYGGGDAHPALREIFGVEFLGDHGPRRTLSCRVAQADVLGRLASFDAKLDIPAFALLGHGGATVVATDATGSPLLTVHQYGQGRAALIAAPVERALAQGDAWVAPAAVRAMLRGVYGAVAAGAGCGAQVGCDVPEVEVALFAGEEDGVLLLLNHSPEKVTAQLTFDQAVATVEDVRGGTPVTVGGTSFGAPLTANGANALRLRYAR